MSAIQIYVNHLFLFTAVQKPVGIPGKRTFELLFDCEKYGQYFSNALFTLLSLLSSVPFQYSKRK